ncbi:MAG: FliH/SctL family protein [Myxococcota bacterium]
MTRDSKLFENEASVDRAPFGARERIENWKAAATSAERWRPMRSVLTAETDVEVQNLIDAAVDQAREEMSREVEEKVETLSRSVVALEAAREKTLRETEGDLVDLALHIAGEVLGISIDERREFTQRMTEHALGLLREADRVVLRVAPEYADELRVHLAARERGTTTVDIVEDPEVKDAGVIAECELGRVDATLSRRLAEAADLLSGGTKE